MMEGSVKKSICLSSVVCALLFFDPAVFASQNSHSTIRLASSDRDNETINELLLFWDEKDLYVETATRHEKKISQVAEDMTVITAKEIEDMNAHTVAEVLNRVTGIFMDFGGQDFGSSSQIHIQSSIHPSFPERHVLVLLDGIEWNLLTDGHAETVSIPVEIIKRIEVIKGPASSSWGSSLGGVVNIITKDAGDTPQTSGTLSASYGEANSQDYRGEISGKAGRVGYYLFAGKQKSDGLSNNRSFDNYSLYSKFSLPLSQDVNVGVSVGYSDPHMKSFESPDLDLTAKLFFRTFFATANLDATISSELTLNIALRTFRQEAGQLNNVLSTGDLLLNNISDEETTGGSAKLVWKHGIHTAVFGFDASHGSDDQTLEGIFMSTPHSVIDKWAVFANDTISLGRFSITPGIRFDHNNITGSFTSPSLGVTYKVAEKTILRASVARGFTIPPLGWTAGGALFLDPNPDLKSESVWSYQAGIESGVCDFLWVKATAFYHDLKDAIVKVPFAGGPPGCSGLACNDLFENVGKVRRHGFELEAETAPFHNFSLKAGFAYVHTKTSTDSETVTVPPPNAAYEYNVAVKYEDPANLMVQLFGHYGWWNLNDPGFNDPLTKYNDFVWDLNLRKRVYTCGKTSAEVFLTGHNLLNGSQYALSLAKNPTRWVEGGLRFKF
jgi:vitamin B12 transporter